MKACAILREECESRVACFCEDAKGTLWFKEMLVVPKREALKKKILDEACIKVLHSSWEH
jgi:hypothetical protein